MQDNSTDKSFQVLPVTEAFQALRVLSNERLLTGLDEWRHHIDADSLSSFDRQLVESTRKQPPTKFGYADNPSIWTGTHFFLALPALSYALMKYGKEDKQTQGMIFTKSQLTAYFIAFPHIAQHFMEYQDFVQRFGLPTIEWWDKTMQAAFRKIKSDSTMPDILKKVSPYLRSKVKRVLSGHKDSLVGRIVLAYLLSLGVPPESLKVDRRASKFLASINGHPSKSLYERLIHAQQELGDLQPYLAEYDPNKGIQLGKLLGVVTWYGRPHLVEMMVPGLIGAAEPAIKSLLSLFAQIIQDGGPDYTKPPIHALPSAQKFRETQSLSQIGRLSLVKDMLSVDVEGEASDGVILRALASRIYDDSERIEAWGNSRYYVPDNRTGMLSFATFRQDIGNILFCAGLMTETAGKTAAVQSSALKDLAKKVNAADTFDTMQRIITLNRQVIVGLVKRWGKQYPKHERLRIMRFIQHTFGLDPIRPIPISLDELNKSFAGSRYDGQKYYLCYQEAEETIELAIDLPLPRMSGRSAPRPVTYHIIENESKILPVTPDGLPYGAWLEFPSDSVNRQTIIIPVPSRGSFDPFGREGNVHAGEVIGFGCSVHHACLAVALAELASLGASRTDLGKIKTSFMQINYGLHERHDLANFQLAQTAAAFEREQMLSYTDYLKVHTEIVHDPHRPHLASYLIPGKKSVQWAEPQAGRLAFGYPELYPYTSGLKVNPRCSWYDGRTVKAPKGIMRWQVLSARTNVAA